jgi:hypothetical protein
MAAGVIAGCSPTTSDTDFNPKKPSNPFPADGATGTNRILTLTWNCSHPVGDPLRYRVDFYSGMDSLTIDWSRSDVIGKSIALPETLDANANYGWQVTVYEANDHEDDCQGDFWTFETGIDAHSPPDLPANPIPEHFASGVPVTTPLSWTCSDPDPGDTLRYDVYFGTNTLELVSARQLETTYDPGLLDFDGIYDWQIVAHDEFGDSTVGPPWRFFTQDDTGSDIWAALVLSRFLDWNSPYLTAIDSISARFDAQFAPRDPIVPLRAGGVDCFNYRLEWIDEKDRFVYTQIVPPREFLTLNGEYVFSVTEGGGVPDAMVLAVMPSCAPYVTSPEHYNEVSVSGFTATWEGTCGGYVQLLVLYASGVYAGVDVTTENDGSYTFTPEDLSQIPNLVSLYQLVLIYQNTQSIGIQGYDSRSYSRGRTLNRTFIYFYEP